MKTGDDKSAYKPFKTATTLLLLLGVVSLTLLPMILLKTGDFGGADGQAAAVVKELKPDFVPWFTPLWEPPSSEIESLLFSLQAAIGAGILGYMLGLWKGRKEKEDDNQ